MILLFKNIFKKINNLFKNKFHKHREDGSAIECCSNGNKYWYLNGKLHREDGPAFECYNGGKAWWINGKLHRIDGPAVEYLYRYKQWFIYAEEISSIKDIMDIYDFII